MADRRRSIRQPVGLLFNKYAEGHPYLCRSVDLSPRGILVESFVEPDSACESFALELQLPGEERRVWVWARRVWRMGRLQALEFLGMHPRDRARLDTFLFAPG